jgi:hypothetical protein
MSKMTCTARLHPGDLGATHSRTLANWSAEECGARRPHRVPEIRERNRSHRLAAMFRRLSPHCGRFDLVITPKELGLGHGEVAGSWPPPSPELRLPTALAHVRKASGYLLEV